MSYPGGKASAGVYQRLISMMPPHRRYFEPFLGGGAILYNKRPARKSFACDLDASVLDAQRYDHIPKLSLRHECGIRFLNYFGEENWQKSDLVYCDPPYLLETRRSQRPLYQHEMDVEQHEWLLRVLKSLPCMVMVSGYRSEMYADELGGWRLETFETMTRGGSLATEHVWLNFPEPLELHDYRYLGRNFTDRQRVRRKQERWRQRLEGMPAQERYAMLSVLRELGL